MTKNAKTMGSWKTNNFNNKIYTPEAIVKDMLQWIEPHGTVYEPFKGKGAFTNELEKNEFITKLDWTEIDEGKDFYDNHNEYDFIISNPPFENFTSILEKCFKQAKNVILLFPENKIYISQKRKNMIADFGIYKSRGYDVPKEWSINFPIAAYWFRRWDEDMPIPTGWNKMERNAL